MNNHRICLVLLSPIVQDLALNEQRVPCINIIIVVIQESVFVCCLQLRSAWTESLNPMFQSGSFSTSTPFFGKPRLLGVQSSTCLCLEPSALLRHAYAWADQHMF